MTHLWSGGKVDLRPLQEALTCTAKVEAVTWSCLIVQLIRPTDRDSLPALSALATGPKHRTDCLSTAAALVKEWPFVLQRLLSSPIQYP